MTTGKTAAFAAAVLVAGSLGAVVFGQSTAPRAVRATPRDVQIISGRGSEIGVSIRDVDDADAKGVKPGATSGVLGVVIDEVTAGGPAEKAGIKGGDVIVEFDGERVRSARQFARLVQETPPGRNVPAVLLRAGQKTSVTLVPRAASGFRYFEGMGDLDVFKDFGRNFSLAVPPAPPAAPAPPAPPAAPLPPGFDSFVWRSGSALGITVGDLSPQLADYFGTKEGVLVTSVREDSAAAKAGLKAGDVITSLNGITVDAPAELRRRTQRLEEGEEFSLGVVRDKKPLTIKGKVDPSPERRRTAKSIV